MLNSTVSETSSVFGGGVNKYMHAWLTRALRIADRYRDKIAAYEVLNEENRLPRYLPNGPVADAIAPEITGRLLTKFYRFCKNIDPDRTRITAARRRPRSFSAASTRAARDRCQSYQIS